MFKQGDYIVVLIDISQNDSWKNFVLKQLKDYNKIAPIITPSGYNNSGCNQSYSDFSEKDITWRYANEEEVAEYERLGKPFDTSTMNRFILPDNWYIVTTEESNKDVIDYLNEKSGATSDRTIGNFLTCKDGDLRGWIHHASIETYASDCTEITYQQFKKYVLKQNEVKHKYLTDLLEKLNIK